MRASRASRPSARIAVVIAMKSDSILAKTAKGIAALDGSADLSARAATLLAAIDGRRDMKTLRRKTGGLTVQAVEAAADELLRGGYVQLLGAAAALPEERAEEENPALLMSLDFSALRSQNIGSALGTASVMQVLEAEQERRAMEVEGHGGAGDPTRETQARLEAELRGSLAKELRPRVEEALRVKLRPKIADELRKAFAAGLRPRLEAAVRAQLETELKPRIELELRTRFARQIADMRSQLRNRDDVVSPLALSVEPTDPNNDHATRLFACLSEPVFATDHQGLLTHVNAAWTRVSGHSEQESIGKPLADFFIETDRRAAGAFLGRVAQGTAIRFDHEGELERAEGGTIWVELRAAPFVAAGQDAPGVCGVLRDAAERKRAATELEDVSLQLLLLVDESDTGILIEDVDGMIRQVNPAFCALFGVQAAPFSFEGSATAELIQGIEHAFADVDDLLTHMARIRAAAEDIDNYEVPLSTGRIARLSYRAIAENGPARGHLWIFRTAAAPAADNPESLP